MNKSEAARAFGVSLSSVKRYTKAVREGRSLSPGKAKGKRPTLDEKARRLLEAHLEERPFAKLSERRYYLQIGSRGLGERIDPIADGAADGLWPKKRTLGASERDEFLRAAFRLMVISSIDAERFVFVDECSSNTSLAPLYGWARKGEQEHQKVPHNWGKNITLLSSIGKRMGMGASLVVEGSTNRTVFETYLQDVLCPTLKRGQVVVMDNLSSHKGERVKELIEGRGCQLIYLLPPYSPDFNPIEQAFSKLKSYLREASARSQQTLMELIGEALHTISVSDAEGFFKHCGYRAVVQSL